MKRLYWFLWMDTDGATVVYPQPKAPGFLRKDWRLVAGGTIDAMHAAARLLTTHDGNPAAPTFDGTPPEENS